MSFSPLVRQLHVSLVLLDASRDQPVVYSEAHYMHDANKQGKSVVVVGNVLAQKDPHEVVNLEDFKDELDREEYDMPYESPHILTQHLARGARMLSWGAPQVVDCTQEDVKDDASVDNHGRVESGEQFHVADPFSDVALVNFLLTLLLICMVVGQKIHSSRAEAADDRGFGQDEEVLPELE